MGEYNFMKSMECQSWFWPNTKRATVHPRPHGLHRSNNQTDLYEKATVQLQLHHSKILKFLLYQKNYKKHLKKNFYNSLCSLLKGVFSLVSPFSEPLCGQAGEEDREWILRWHLPGHKHLHGGGRWVIGQTTTNIQQPVYGSLATSLWVISNQSLGH